MQRLNKSLIIVVELLLLLLQVVLLIRNIACVNVLSWKNILGQVYSSLQFIKFLGMKSATLVDSHCQSYLRLFENDFYFNVCCVPLLVYCLSDTNNAHYITPCITTLGKGSKLDKLLIIILLQNIWSNWWDPFSSCDKCSTSLILYN